MMLIARATYCAMADRYERAAVEARHGQMLAREQAEDAWMTAFSGIAEFLESTAAGLRYQIGIADIMMLGNCEPEGHC